MQQPLISIIVPVFNVEPYISECLDSIISQSFSNYEVILIDDGSTDSSPAICDEYADKYPQIHIIHKENGGVSTARNVGLDVAKGEWIWFVDADDYVVEYSLNILSTTIEHHNCDTIFSGLIHVFEDGRTVQDTHNSDFDSNKSDFLNRNMCFQNGMMLFYNDIIQKFHLRFTEGIKMGEDLEFQYKYLMLCKHPVRVAENLYFYRRREGSAIANPDSYKLNMLNNISNAKSLYTFVLENKISPDNWIEQRLCRMIKTSIQSSLYVAENNRLNLQNDLNILLRLYGEIGFRVKDKTLYFASKSMSLYAFIWCCYTKFITLTNRKY